MPLLKITTSVDLTEIHERLLAEGTRAVVDGMGKPVQWVMVVCERAPMAFGGTTDPCALVELRSLGGLGPDTNAPLTARLTAMLHDIAAIPPQRVFVNFTDVPRQDWGWNDRTFGD
jgi:phenylpyruvate tautomerase PptA (4-oxalocrotonate tautomerase family)